MTETIDKPRIITQVRHAQSDYNEGKELREQNPTYVEFLKLRDDYIELRNKDTSAEAFIGFSEETKLALIAAQALGEQLMYDKSFVVGADDANTDITEYGEYQALQTGIGLREEYGDEVPDIVYTSPYLRTKKTLALLQEGWPKLSEVKVVEDERLREQEHGLRTIYADWRVAEVMFPDQRLLRSAQGPYWYRYPQGENVPDVRERARSMFTTFVREHSNQHVMVITHHLFKLAWRANHERWKDVEFIRQNRENRPDNCGVTTYAFDKNSGKNGKLVIPSGGYSKVYYDKK